MQVIPQTLARHVSLEMLALCLAETGLTFILTLILFSPVSGHITASISPAIVSALILGVIAFISGLYRPAIFQGATKLLGGTIVCAVVSFPAVWFVTRWFGLDSLWPVNYDSFRPVKVVAVWTLGFLLIRFAFLLATRCNLFVHRVALVSSTEGSADLLAARLSRSGFLELRVIRPEHASASNLHAQRVRTLILPRADHVVASIVNEYRRLGVEIRARSEFWETHLRRVNLQDLTAEWFDQPDIRKSRENRSFSRRSFDVVASLTVLFITFPIAALVGLLVRLDSPGPIFYKQERVGLNGVHFTLLKFRSMKVDAEHGGPSWAQDKDPRITRVGVFMRKTRIDELPQLLNILRGEMSFIGPRPERPHFVEQLSSIIPFYERRSDVKPGLTGWAQVNFPYGASVEDARSKLSYDLYYVRHRNFILNCLIILSTIRVVLFQEGAR